MPTRIRPLPGTEQQRAALESRQPRFVPRGPAGDRRLVPFRPGSQDLVARSKDMRPAAGSLPPRLATTHFRHKRQRWRARPCTTPPSRAPGPEQVVPPMPAGWQESPAGAWRNSPQTATPCLAAEAAACAMPSTTWRRICWPSAGSGETAPPQLASEAAVSIQPIQRMRRCGARSHGGRSPEAGVVPGGSTAPKQAEDQQRLIGRPRALAPSSAPAMGPCSSSTDRIDLALAVEADGSNLGQGDLPRPSPGACWRPRRPLIRRSTNRLERFPGRPWPTACVTSGWGRSCHATQAGRFETGGVGLCAPGGGDQYRCSPSFAIGGIVTPATLGAVVAAAPGSGRGAGVMRPEDAWRAPAAQLLATPAGRKLHESTEPTVMVSAHTDELREPCHCASLLCDDEDPALVFG